VHLPKPADGSARPLCCGRTFLAVGLVEEARREAERTVAAIAPFVSRGIPLVGLEPSCMLGFRDEIPGLVKAEDAKVLGRNAVLFEEFLENAASADGLELPLKPIAPRALVHGHCHQKAFGAMSAVETVLRLVPELAVEVVESSCCGMAGSFGYGADTIDVSSAMAELSLLPAIRKASRDTLIVADGVSCRTQIKDGAKREALHVARVLAMSLNGEKSRLQ
jgi:Fe-S oxidoreductase